MALSFAPFGLLPASAHGSHGNEVREYAAPNGAACPDLAKGDAVGLTGGVVVSAGGGTGPLLGVFIGAAWIDPTSKQPVMDQYLPADTSSAGFINGENRPMVYIADSPDNIYVVQADASVSAGDVGLNFNVTTLGADTVYGVSRMALDASTRTSAVTGAVKLLGLAKVPDNAWSDPYPMVLVRLNSAVALVSAT